MVTAKQGKKKVTVSVDDVTAKLLQIAPAEIRQIYLEEEYEAQKQDRAETRRHISLEHSMQTGHDYESSLDSPEQEFINKEMRVRIKDMLDKLTQKQREVITLAIFEGMSLHKIAQTLGISAPTVHEIYHAAINKLEKYKNFF